MTIPIDDPDDGHLRSARSPDARSKSQAVADLRAFHARMVAQHGYLPDSCELIRQMRGDK